MNPHPESRWTHNICLTCWIKKKGSQQPVHLFGAMPERCCYCNQYNNDSIYYRDDPAIVHPEGESK